MGPRSIMAFGAVVALLGALPSRAAVAKRAKVHVPVEAAQDCASCHRTRTPAAFAEWERSQHGLALVTCVVCHGSTGRDFRAKPAAAGCGSCHPAQAESVARRHLADCFACHAPHSLAVDPHR